MIEKLNSQEDMGPLEELTQFTKHAKDAKGLLIAAGATAYAEFGLIMVQKRILRIVNLKKSILLL